MTYDKLLAKIETAEINFRNVIKQYNAIRAVMELHVEDVGTPMDDPISVCDYCKVAHPCPTIQAIEKELA